MTRITSLGSIVLALSLAAPALGEVSVKAGVDAEIIGTEDHVQYTVTVTTDNDANDNAMPAPAVEAPPFDGAAEVQGPSMSQQTSMSFGGGGSQVTRHIIYSWVLIPQASRGGTKLVEGAIRIGPAKVTVGGKAYATDPITVKVTEGRLRAQAQRRRARSPWDDSFFGGDPFEQMFERSRVQERGYLDIVAQLDKTRAYVGEGITLSFRVRTNVQLTNLRLEQGPKLPGFRVEEVKLPDRPMEEEVVVEGKRLTTAIVKQMILYPLAPGSQTIPETEWFAQALSQSPWSVPQQVAPKTRAAAVEVVALPAEGRPEPFGGAVGRFSLQAVLDKSQASVDEPVTLRVTLKGTGDLRGVTALPLPKLGDFKIYDPKIGESIETKGGRTRSEKSFEYVLIPKAPGAQEIPPIAWSYFDPEAKAYATATTAALPLSIERGAAAPDEAAGSVPQPVAAREVAVVGQDIRYLKGPPDAVAAGIPPWRRAWFLALVLAPIAGNAGLGLWVLRRSHRAQNVGAYRARGALGRGLRGVKRAARALRSMDEKIFHGQLADALTGYLADTFDQPAAGLSSFRIDGMLEARGCPEPLRREAKELLAECDFARFTPAGAQQGEMKRRAERAATLLRDLDRQLSRSGRRAAAVAAVLLLISTTAGQAGAAPPPPSPGPGATWEKATALYAAGDFDGSVALWREMRGAFGADGAVHFNLGNALLRAGHVGPAIASYRRALRATPGDPDARANLAFATERAVDEVARTPLQEGLGRKAMEAVPPSVTAAAFAILLAAGQLALALGILIPRMRGLALSACGVLTLMALGSGAFAAAGVAEERSRVEAVVVVPKVEVRSGPGEENTVLFVVHEGLTASLRQEQGAWALVTLPNDLTGWLPAAALELVRSPLVSP